MKARIGFLLACCLVIALAFAPAQAAGYPLPVNVLDHFNRPDGALGPNWTGFSDGLHYLIGGEAGQAWYGGPIYWSQGSAFGTAQEAFVTFTAVNAAAGLDNGLLLKVQSDPTWADPSNNPNWIKGTIGAFYNAVDHNVYVATWRPGSDTWNIYASQPLTMADGDVLAARALPNGNIEVYRNRALAAMFTLNANDQAFFNGRGGHIGLWFEQAATARFDDFGGGTIQAEASCSIDLVNNVHDCAIPGVSFVVEPSGGQTVLKVNLDPRGSGYTKAVFDVQYGATPAGWTVDIGDSATNDGHGHDAGTQNNDAELDVLDGTFGVFGNDYTPGPNPDQLLNVPGFAFAGATLTFEVSNKKLAYDNHAGLANSLASPYLYALNAQPDCEGPVNYDVFAAFNRVIAPWSPRSGTGVILVNVRLSTEPTSCSVDLLNNTHTCAGLAAVHFEMPPAGGQTVMKVNLDRNDSGFNKAVFDVRYGTYPSGWTVNIGDSATNNGAGGDGATQTNDAELDVLGGTLRVFGKDGSPSYPQPLLSVPGFAGATLTFEVSNEKLAYDNHAGLASSLASRYLYALNGQPDTEGSVNYDVFAAFNRVIDRWTSRSGTGVIRVDVRLSAESPACKVDLVNNTHTCAGVEAVQFVTPPAGGQTVMKVNLDRNGSGFNKAVFDVCYGAAPTGWTVNIGDSATNNGGGNDAGTQSNDAELDVFDGTFSVFGKDGSPSYPQPLLNVPGFAGVNTTLTFEVSNEKVLYDNHAGTASSLASPYLYALNGQPDSEGPVNYDVFAAFNRVIDGSYRSGTGVREVTLRLLTQP